MIHTMVVCLMHLTRVQHQEQLIHTCINNVLVENRWTNSKVFIGVFLLVPGGGTST